MNLSHTQRCLEGLLAILERGPANGTHKFVTLLALIDTAPEFVCKNGEPPVSVSTRRVAERVVELHWDHVLPFAPSTGEPFVLRQVGRGTKTSRGPNVYIRLIARLRSSIGDRGSARPADIDPALLSEVVLEVERALLRNPLRRLQTIRGKDVPFLYRVEKSVSNDTAAELLLETGAGEALLRFGPVLRPLVENRFVDQIERLNNEVDTESRLLRTHLFEGDRAMPPKPLREAIRILQENRCIYRRTELESAISIDHVVPWSRRRISTIENFVATTPSANSSKSDLLLAPDLLTMWVESTLRNHSRLKELAASHNWATNLPLTARLAISLYARLPDGAPVWNGDGAIAAPQGSSRVAVASLQRLFVVH